LDRSGGKKIRARKLVWEREGRLRKYTEYINLTKCGGEASTVDLNFRMEDRR
jgi:hypothetical protein